MARASDVLFMTEYIKNVLYFATVRQGKILKNTADTHYFCIDNDLIYENYYSDFGPLNLGCVYKYCKILNEKLKLYLNKQCIVHYTSIDPKKKANAAFLMGCYGVLYLSLPPKDALKPLINQGQSYRPFQDATQGDSNYTITIMDCLQGISKARDLGFFDFHDFNYEEYERLDKIQGGDLNWIVPGEQGIVSYGKVTISHTKKSSVSLQLIIAAKFLAFIGPVDYHHVATMYHPPEMYVDYFRENNVQIVMRLNKKLYDSNAFINGGIAHYNLFFPDGSCPSRRILLKFLQISEECDGAIAVHCKAGLGRTGSLIGSYLMKHYRMTAHEAIAWMRICRPGSVIGHQQGWLEELEAWLIKQGNLYRRRTFQDINRIPNHDYGIYSISEKAYKQLPLLYSKSPSPPPPMQRQNRKEMGPTARPQASKLREETESDEDEFFITSCDLTLQPTEKVAPMKGCVIKSNINEEFNCGDNEIENIPLWKKYLCCKPCKRSCYDKLWMLVVRSAKLAPKQWNNSYRCCLLIDMVPPGKTTEKDRFEWNEQMNTIRNVPFSKRIPSEVNDARSRRGSGGGEPRTVRTSRSNTPNVKGIPNAEFGVKTNGWYYACPTYRGTGPVPIAKTLNDSRKLLMRSTVYTDKKEKRLESAITVKPQYSFRVPNIERTTPGEVTKIAPCNFNQVSRNPTQPINRRRLGRSPSPPPTRATCDKTRATNTSPAENFSSHDSKAALKEALSRLKLSVPQDGSIGAASLGARRDAPSGRRAPSVRSDERPFATQGDLLNSIKFQRRIRDTLVTGKKVADKNSILPKEKPVVCRVNSKTSTEAKQGGVGGHGHDISKPRDKTQPSLVRGFHSPRPSSPKGRRSPHLPFC